MDKTPYCKLHFSNEAKEILEQGYKVYITRPVDEDNVFGKNLVEVYL